MLYVSILILGFIFFIYSHERIEILAIAGEPVFFKQRDDFMPTLKLLHKCKEWYQRKIRSAQQIFHNKSKSRKRSPLSTLRQLRESFQRVQSPLKTTVTLRFVELINGFNPTFMQMYTIQYVSFQKVVAIFQILPTIRSEYVHAGRTALQESL